LKILVLSFYYQPDLCAGSFRCGALIEQLKKQNAEIEVITTLPNRYASFSAQAPEHESSANLQVHRIALPAHKSGMLDQIKAFSTFYRKALQLSAHKDYDLVFATSSRLFTAFLGARIATKKKLPLYLDIRDIFVDTMKDVLSPKLAMLVKPVFSLVERYTFKRAKRINLVSEGFRAYFEERYPQQEYRFFTNGIDDEFMAVAPVVEGLLNKNKKVRVLYAGNIGEGQGLHKILPNLAKRFIDQVEFTVIGDGGRKVMLINELADRSHVRILPPANREELILEYQQADVLFLHLNDYPAFRKVLPSKIFEYAALGKPIWAGVSGYAAEFLRKEVDNCAVFNPGNDQDAADSFIGLQLQDKPRDRFISKFSRSNIMAAMAEDIKGFAHDYAS
jgi:hypothetical protein